MSDPAVPSWLKSLPFAPIYRPTETEFSDPIAYISKIEREASAFGICKVIPPLPKPSKRFILSNLNKSLSHSPEHPAGDSSTPPPVSNDGAAMFTTRQQELGFSQRRPRAGHQQVWHSGNFYTLDHFEAKSKSFSKSYLSGYKEINPLLIESLFWKAACGDKPIYIEYANDVPGSGFAAPEDDPRPLERRRRHGKDRSGLEMEGTAGWKLSNSPWNLQVIARSQGSLTRYMPDDIPGVTTPMVYIGMLFSWFAWHVEDHELHSLNFLHMGAPKTWYAVPAEYASALEEIVRVEGYGKNVDSLAALGMLGEKTTLLSPEVLVASGIPLFRLVQHPGEFVVTFPRAYHVGFSHGYNCGEAANFATPQWLNVAKEAAIRRAAMNHLPMLSHQQLLYVLTMSFIFRVPRELLATFRSSRLRDRMKEERELLIKKAFLTDLMIENRLLSVLLEKKSTEGVVLWDPEMLRNQSSLPQSCCPSIGEPMSLAVDERTEDTVECSLDERGNGENGKLSTEMDKLAADLSKPLSNGICVCIQNKATQHDMKSDSGMESLYVDDDDLPFGLHVDSGSLACVACGILGYPFMVIIQPSERAGEELVLENHEASSLKLASAETLKLCSPACHVETPNKSKSGDASKVNDAVTAYKGESDECASRNVKDTEVPDEVRNTLSQQIDSNEKICSSLPASHSLQMISLDDNGFTISTRSNDSKESSVWSSIETCNRNLSSGSIMNPLEMGNLSSLTSESTSEINNLWNVTSSFMRPRIFCLEHALEIEKMLQHKGGVHALIICYSDFPKIKAQAVAVAEDVGMQFEFKDVALENGSPEDLDLINISIDDENHEEHGEDWTSKLGVNLKHSIELQKQSSNQGHSTLALSSIFSNVHKRFPRLSWQSKRSRTPKIYYLSQPNPCVDSAKEEDASAASKTNIFVYRRLRKRMVRNNHGSAEVEVQVSVPGKPNRKRRAVPSKNTYAIQLRPEISSRNEHDGLFEVFIHLEKVSGIGTQILSKSLMQQNAQHVTDTNLSFEGHNIQPDGSMKSMHERLHQMSADIHEKDLEAVTTESMQILHPVKLSVSESSRMQDILHRISGNSVLEHAPPLELKKDYEQPIIVYTRRADRNNTKRKREQQVTDSSSGFVLFIRSPCEGLRPRIGRTSMGQKNKVSVVESHRSCSRESQIR